MVISNNTKYLIIIACMAVTGYFLYKKYHTVKK
jgi:hypothetical protein